MRLIWRSGLAVPLMLGGCTALLVGAIALMAWVATSNMPDDSEVLRLPLSICIVLFGCLAVFTASMAVVLFKIWIGVDGPLLTGTVLSGSRWGVPHFRPVRIALQDIRAVEQRRETRRRMGVTLARQTLSIVTASKGRIPLLSQNGDGRWSPKLTEIAGAIASVAGVAVTKRGMVRVDSFGLYGEVSPIWNEVPLPPTQERRVIRAVVLTANVVFGLLVLARLLHACVSN
jgi:Ca2+/Na+ antiporter